MKRIGLIAGCWMATLGGIGAQGTAPGDSKGAAAEVERIGILPHQRQALDVRTDERNPFAVLSPVKDEPKVEDTSLQETVIRQRFAEASVDGVTRTADGYKVLIGGMILSEGAFVPPIIPNQTERLKVREITEEHVVLAWVETDKDSGKTRELRIPVNVKPAVGVRVVGSDAGGDSMVYRRMGDLQEEMKLKPEGDSLAAPGPGR